MNKLGLMSLITLGLACTALSCPAKAAEKDVSGKYCENFIHQTEVDKAPGAPCEAPAFIRDLDQTCVTDRVATDYLQLDVKDDGTLDFAFSLWFPPYAHYCGMSGNAQRSKDGWTYQSNISAKSYQSRCILNFKNDEENNRISISNDPDATCHTMCGFHTNLGFLHFPKSLKEANRPDDRAFELGYYMELEENGGPTCSGEANRYPEETLVEKYIPQTR